MHWIAKQSLPDMSLLFFRDRNYLTALINGELEHPHEAFASHAFVGQHQLIRRSRPKLLGSKQRERTEARRAAVAKHSRALLGVTDYVPRERTIRNFTLFTLLVDLNVGVNSGLIRLVRVISGKYRLRDALELRARSDLHRRSTT